MVELVNLFVVNGSAASISESIVSPSNVFDWDSVVLDTAENGDWDVLDPGDVDHWSFFGLPISLFVLLSAVVEFLELIVLSNLGVMSKLLPGSWLLIGERDDFSFWIIVLG